MNLDVIYQNCIGRKAVIICQRVGVFKLISKFLQSNKSRFLISRYIHKHKIDMKEYEGNSYNSFAEFFSRKRTDVQLNSFPEELISPCDGMLSAYKIESNLSISMKNSYYRLEDLIPDKNICDSFMDGLCLVFRLQASDYHRFCAFDDAIVGKANYIPGMLHSVQPIACEKVPVYRLNRRWWSILNTFHFGLAAQIEVGAMFVGDVHFERDPGCLKRGEEMGHFELSGSTILILLTKDISERLQFYTRYFVAISHDVEIPVRMGESLGVLKSNCHKDNSECKSIDVIKY